MPSLNRIQFSDTDGSNIYTAPINPSAVRLEDNSEVAVKRTLDGAPVVQYSTFDGRTRSLAWGNFTDTNVNFAALEVELKSYVGTAKRLNLKDIDTPGRGWKNIIVTNVKTKIMNNQGNLRHNLVCEFVYTESI